VKYQHGGCVDKPGFVRICDEEGLGYRGNVGGLLGRPYPYMQKSGDRYCLTAYGDSKV
jgi:hypothetical protein